MIQRFFRWLFGNRRRRADRTAHYAHVCGFLWPSNGFASREHWHNGKLVRVELTPILRDKPAKPETAIRLTVEQAARDNATANIIKDWP